jgi:hypothetical protein
MSKITEVQTTIFQALEIIKDLRSTLESTERAIGTIQSYSLKDEPAKYREFLVAKTEEALKRMKRLEESRVLESRLQFLKIQVNHLS